MSGLNIELFKKIRERIETVPESYNQGTWVRDSKTSPCGTAACLAGEAIICAAPTIVEGIDELRRLDDANSVPARAGEILGLPDGANYWLYNVETIFDEDAQGWPEPFQQQFRDGDQHGAVLAYLDHIIATGSIE